MMSLVEQHKNQLQQIFFAGIAAVQPSLLIRKWIQINKGEIKIGTQSFKQGLSFNKIFIIGAGKASASMAAELEMILGDMIEDGLVITKYNHAVATSKVKIVEASHPIPDQQSVVGTDTMMKLLNKVRNDDLIICLWSGGASALMTDIPEDITIDDLISINDLLLHSGANINELNTVRKHLSILKGGQLIRFCNQANIISLLISDVPSDNISVIASGPTAPDDSTFLDAKNIIDALNDAPQNIVQRIEKGLNGEIAETLDLSDPVFNKVKNWIIGNNKMALDAAMQKAVDLGYAVEMIPEMITGDTDAEAIRFVDRVMKKNGDKKICLIQGGETTIKIFGNGKGGRNQHFALKVLQELMYQYKDQLHLPHISILAAGTDGTDGPTDAAGALVHLDKNSSVEEMEQYLNRQDSYSFHEKYGNLFLTGPTQTNVMDVMIALIN
ncbi:MAG: glycerate kinase type-2 family protein [Chitinophagaceae bacterium]